MKASLSSPIYRALLVVFLGATAVGICLAGGARVGDSAADATTGLSIDLPDRVGEWQGLSGEVSRAEKEILPEDTEFTKMDYRRRSSAGAGSDQIHCSIVLSGKDRTSIHRPEVCLVGQGWNIDSSSERMITLRNNIDLSVRCLELSRGDDTDEHGGVRRALYYYWFVGGEATTADHLERILLTAKANVLDNRNPRWAYVSVLAGMPSSAPDRSVQAFERTAAMLENFVARVTPEFQTAFQPAEIF